MRILKISGILLGLAVATSTFSANQAYASDCYSSVKGLSSNYNKAKGNGFLAVRSRPSSSSRELGELFNGERINVFAKKGRWFEIAFRGGSAWVFGKYVRLGCPVGDLALG